MMNFVLTNVLRTKLTGLSLGCFSSYIIFIHILFTPERVYRLLVKRAAKAHLDFWPILVSLTLLSNLPCLFISVQDLEVWASAGMCSTHWDLHFYIRMR